MPTLMLLIFLVTHDWIDRLNAFSTLVIAAFTALLVFVVCRQLSASKTIERAWVMAEVEPGSDKFADRKPHVIEGSGTDGDSTAIYAVLICTNTGKTPAWIEETVAKFEIVKKLPEIPNFDSAEYIQRSTIPLGMADGGSLPHTQRLSWVPVAKGHRHLDDTAVLYGRITYRDIFNETRITTFGYKMRPHGSLDRLEGYPRYNANT